MWDYDKLFASNNIVGIKDKITKKVSISLISDNEGLPKEAWYNHFGKYWDKFKNIYLASSTVFIQYIIRLDEHGNVVEKLFDRDRDMKEPEPMPDLKTGMFVRVVDNGDMKRTALGYVDIRNCRVIYQNGQYNDIVKLERLNGIVDIVEVCSQKTNCFNQCFGNNTLIWRDPDYQAYLDSKSK